MMIVVVMVMVVVIVELCDRNRDGDGDSDSDGDGSRDRSCDRNRDGDRDQDRNGSRDMIPHLLQPVQVLQVHLGSPLRYKSFGNTDIFLKQRFKIMLSP